MAKIFTKQGLLLAVLSCLLVFGFAGTVLAGDSFEYDSLGNPLAKQEENKPTYENKSIVGTDFTVLSGRIAGALVGLVGSVVFIMVVYGGLMWIFASGNEEKVGKAKKTIVWSIIGLIVVAAAYVVISFTITNSQRATQILEQQQ